MAEKESKILSGRWFLTVIGGLVFVYAVMQGILKEETVASILVMIFVSYFQRQDRGGQNGKNSNGGSNPNATG